MINTIYPLAESSYYVFPPAVVSEIFKYNSLTQAQEIHNVNPQKLQQIFGADAVLYINVEEYGVNYQIFDSVTKVKVRENWWTCVTKKPYGKAQHTRMIPTATTITVL